MDYESIERSIELEAERIKREAEKVARMSQLCNDMAANGRSIVDHPFHFVQKAQAELSRDEFTWVVYRLAIAADIQKLEPLLP